MMMVPERVWFAALAAALAIALVATYRHAPLFPMRTRDTAWLRPWLAFSVADFYGVAAVLAVIMVRAHGMAGLAWAVATLVFGSPVACAYAAWTSLAAVPALPVGAVLT